MSRLLSFYLGTTFGSFDDTLSLIKDGLRHLGVEITRIEGRDGDLDVEIDSSAGARLTVCCARDASPRRIDPLRAGLHMNVVLAAATMEDAADAQLVAVVAKLRGSLERFTASELERVSELNPMVTSICERYRRDGISLADVHLVLRDHLLLEKLNLVRSLLSLGLSPARCWLLGKEDRTLFAGQVIAEYARLGCNILGAHYSEELAAAASSVALQLRGQHVLVVDDGGDLIAAMHPLAQRIGFSMVPVETTSKGIAQLRRNEIPTVDLATSSIKCSLSRDIAVSCVVRARDILQHERLARERCHVIGYGKLGQHVANLLRELGVTVTISDPDPARRAAAEAAGFDSTSDVGEALRSQKHRFLFGCSGVPALSALDLESMLDPTYLVSASSQDLKRAIAHLRENANMSSRPGFGDTYRWGRRVIHVIAHGHAVNLYQSEGVSEPEYDAFTALLAVAIVELAGSHRHDAFDVTHVDVNALCALVAASAVAEP